MFHCLHYYFCPNENAFARKYIPLSRFGLSIIVCPLFTIVISGFWLRGHNKSGGKILFNTESVSIFIGLCLSPLHVGKFVPHVAGPQIEKTAYQILYFKFQIEIK